MSVQCPVPVIQPPNRYDASVSWLQVASHLDPKFGGIAASLPMFCEAAEAEGVRSPTVSFCGIEEFSAAAPRHDTTCVPAGRLRWMFDPRLRGSMSRAIRKSDGVHIHGIWEAHCTVAAGLARACRRPYVLSAHGMLERWALQHKRLKKALYAALIETDNLRRASCLRALTRAEVDDYRRIGLTNPVAIVPGGVSVPANVCSAGFLEAHPQLRGKRIVLFLGRLHQKKGLTLLVDAWARCASSFRDAHLVLAGPDFDGTRAALERRVDELGLSSQVTFAGMLDGPTKWSALTAASVFVLPSFSEGFSVAVLEALGIGTPVIVTRPCNIPEVGETGCGWVIEPEERAVEGALEESLRSSGIELKRMGDKGRALVERRFTWSVVGKQMVEVYEWLQGGSRPASVQTFPA